MAIRENSYIIDAIKAALGERTDDEAISLLEDVTDTLTDYSTRTQDSTDWQKKYNDNDAAWRARYIGRFNGTSSSEDFISGQSTSVEVITSEEAEVKETTWNDIYE